MSSLDHVPCKKCGKDAQKVLISHGSVTSGHIPDIPGPQNTGASLVDHEVDWVIATESRMRLKEMQIRSDYKRRKADAAKVSGHYLSRLSEGDYFVMTEEERLAAKRARLLHQDAIREMNKIRRKQ
jgi:hypothetical protein